MKQSTASKILKYTLSNAQLRLEKLNSYLERTQEKQKKEKRFTKLDIALFSIIVSFCLIIFFQPQNALPPSKSVPDQQTIVKPDTPTSTLSNNAGRGGGAPTVAPPDCSNGECQIDTSGAIDAIISSVPIQTGKDWLINNDGTGAVFTTDLKKTVDDPNIQKLWGVMVTIVLAVLVIVVIINGYKIMGGAFGFRHAEALETLSRVFLSTIGAVLSSVFVAFLITLENGINQMIVSAMNSGDISHTLQYTDMVLPTSAWWIWPVALVIALILALAVFLISSIPVIRAIVALIGGGVLEAVAGGFVALALRNSILAMLSLMLLFQLQMRLITICLYIVSGPLLIGLSAVRMDLAQRWFSGLTSLVFVQTAQVLTLSIGLIFFQSIPGMATPSGNWLDNMDIWKFMGTFTGLGLSNIFSHLFDFVGPIVTLWLTIRIPRIFGSSALSPMISAGQTVVAGAAFAGTMAGAAAGGIAEQIDRERERERIKRLKR